MRLHSVACCLMFLGATWTAPGLHAFDFADAVAERNSSPVGMSHEVFTSGGDSINRFNGALNVSVPLGLPYAVSSHLSYSFALNYTSQTWQLDAGGPTVAAQPGLFNAGLGWRFSFGEVFGPSTSGNPDAFWLYRAPDGRLHRFYATLHDGEAVDAGVFYTRDGSYWRLRTLSATAIEIDSRDGRIQQYSQDGSGQWLFDSESDPFGNSWSVSYSTPDQWVVTDDHGRTHRIHFRADPSGSGAPVVDRLDLAAFGGQRAIYQLSYDVATVSRPAVDTSPSTPATVTVPVLDRLDRPGNEFQEFSYAVPGTMVDSGRLVRQRLRTGGFLRYTYEGFQFPYLTDAEHTAEPIGVATRTMENRFEAALGTWNFSRSLDIPRIADAVDQPRELTTRIVDPGGNTRDHMFSVYVSGDAMVLGGKGGGGVSFATRDYSLPLTQIGRVSGSAFHPSVLIYHIDGRLLRAQDVGFSQESCAGCFDYNVATSHRQVRYLDEGGLWERQSWSDPDGLGNFRVHQTWNASTSTARQTRFTDFRGDFPGPSEPWILGGYDLRTEGVGAAVRVTEVCSDPATGLLLRQRILAGTERATHDLLRTFTYDARGDLVLTRFYGGDTQPVSADPGDLCTMPLPAIEQYASYEEYSLGQSVGSGWLRADGSVFLASRSVTRDGNTGLPVTSEGADGLAWGYSYDRMGRLVSRTPPLGHEGTTTWIYTPAGEYPNKVRKKITDASGTVDDDIIQVFDGHGRLQRDRLRSAAGWATAVSNYDALGNLTRHTDATGRVTQYLGYDAFGRLIRRRPPEGSVHDRTFSYHGRTTAENVPIRKVTVVGNPPVTVTRTIERTEDHLGRVVVEETRDSDGTLRRKTYTRDAFGAVVETLITDGVRTITLPRPNRFDGRGFEIADSDGNPITGYDALGHRTVENFGQGPVYRAYDRAGRLTTEREGSANGPILTKRTYGTANIAGDQRLGKLWRSTRVNYGVQNVPDGRVEVEERYVYGANGGGLSEVVTEAAAGNGRSMPLLTFSSTREVDTSGRTASLNYPDCDPGANSDSATCFVTPARTLRYERNLGRLTHVWSDLDGEVEDWVNVLETDIRGFVTHRRIGNGVEESITPDAGANRFGRFELSETSSGTLYDSGAAEYDGLGRLVQLGSERLLSRHSYKLTVPPLPSGAGTVPPLPDTTERDAFGMARWRFYRVPYRYGGTSWENVHEVYVYGPDHRLLWLRRFNDFDVGRSGYSWDEWRLRDPEGRHVRTRTGRSYYTGVPSFSLANLDEVAMGDVVFQSDRIFIGRDLLVEIKPISAHPTQASKEFFHRGPDGSILAVTDERGDIEESEAPLW